MILTAVFTAKEGKREALKAELHAGAVESRKEAGIIYYLVNEVEDNPNIFMNIEVKAMKSLITKAQNLN